MKIPGRPIASAIESHLKQEVQALKKAGKQPYLATFLIGNSPEQLSFVSIKEKTSHKLGIKFELIHLKKNPSYEEFARLLKQYSQNKKVTGILIQLPLPPILQSDSVYNFIPTIKEIEGHKPKSPFFPPIGLASLTLLKFILGKGDIDENLIVDMQKDKNFFKTALKHKKIVIVGRGVTGGQPIGKCLSELKLNYLSINSSTYNPAEYYKDADVIITCVGKKILDGGMLKPGVILINVGMRKEEGILKGDYDEREMDKIASYYSATPGGVGPIDVLYLFHNVIEATKLQPM